MPKHKTLQGVANSVVASFASPMNYADGAFIMSELAGMGGVIPAAVEIDLLGGRVTSPHNLSSRALKAIEWYGREFPGIVMRSNSAVEFVRSATLRVAFFPSERLDRSEARCELTIVDDRGRIYVGHSTSWWDHEGPAPAVKPGWLVRAIRYFARRVRALRGVPHN